MHKFTTEQVGRKHVISASMTMSFVPSRLSPSSSVDENSSTDVSKTLSTQYSRSKYGLATPPEEAKLERRYLCQGQLAGLDISHPQLPSSVVAVIGVGYVGFQLATAFAKVYRVIAYDVDQHRIAQIKPMMADLKVHCTSNPQDIASATHFLISVPTKLHHDNTVDTRHLESAIALVAQHARAGSTVIIESSVAVGMTRQLIKDVMLTKGLKAGMSPERVDPGRTSPNFESIPKLISGLDDITPGSLASIHELYQEIFEDLVPVSSPEVAEMTKLYENCQRMVCIAHVNEMADACHAFGINAFEVTAAAATKPFGYQPYSPGLGVGGHCIPVNPYYLLANSRFPLLQAATETMAERPARIGGQVMKKFLEHHIPQGRAPDLRTRVLVVGVGFKRGQSVLSNSPAILLVRYLLSEWETYVEFVDPLVSAEALPFVPKFDEQTQWNKEALEEQFDIVIVAVNQLGLDLSVLESLEGVLVENFATSDFTY